MDIWDLEELIARKDFVCSQVPNCPNCQERMQIQVLNYSATPAQWKCRICKHKFEYEPEPV